MRPKGSAELLSDRRRRALKLLGEKLSLNEVARRIKCAASSVMRWRNAWRRRGADALKVRFSPGRPRRLSPRQEQRLVRILLRGAIANGYRTELWTTKRVAEVIQETFHIPCHYNSAGKLDHVGFTASFRAEQRVELKRIVEPLRGGMGFTGGAPGGPSRWATERSAEWVPLKPELVCEVQYDHFSGGRFRHGTKFLRWRPDKAPRQCTFQQLEPSAKAA